MKLASDFRASAREALKGKWGLAVITGIVASMLGAATHGGGGVSFDFSGFNNPDYEAEPIIPPMDEIDSIEDIFSGIDPAVWGILGTVLAVGITVGLIFGIAFFVLGSITSVGYAKFNLNLIDGANAEVTNLFAYFKYWKTTILANLLRSLYIFLWSLLCFIPGIIASYSYAMVPYIMADEPELTAREACEKSKQMMNGNRMRLFCLTFSFIGWSFLCAITCGIGYIVLTPYIEAAVADFYREISGTRPVLATEEDTPIYIPEA